MIQQNFSKKLTRQSNFRWNKCFTRKQTGRLFKRRGQAIIEMALVVTVLLFLTLGLIQYGLIANAKVTLTNIAREGARYAALHGKDTDADDSASSCPTGTHSVKCRIKTVASTTTLRDLDADNDVTILPAYAARKAGDLVEVTVRYDLRKKLILPAGFPGLSGFGTTEVKASMVLEGRD